MQTKLCRDCGEEKPVTEFYRHQRTRDGRQSYCKDCHHERNNGWKRENPRKVRVHNAAYYRGHREQVIARVTANARQQQAAQEAS